MIRWSAIVILAAGCYHGAAATRDVDAAWRGRTAAEIEATWGPPVAKTANAFAWSFTTPHVELPAAMGAVAITSHSVDVEGAARPGEIWKSETTATATLDPTGRITDVQGASLHWGPPRDENLRWGTLFGAHVGLGRLDGTSTPLPSGGLYIGGMLGPRLGLVGTFSMVTGTGDKGSAIGFAWGMGLQYWPLTRLAVRGGPAFVLAFDPGFGKVSPDLGGNGAVSYAIVRTRIFVLDLRLDATVARSVAFGSVGVGVNVN